MDLNELVTPVLALIVGYVLREISERYPRQSAAIEVITNYFNDDLIQFIAEYMELNEDNLRDAIDAYFGDDSELEIG